MPDCSACTCMLVCVFLCAICTRDRGCSVHPVFPAPSVFEGNFLNNSGASCREMADAYRRGCLKNQIGNLRCDAISLRASVRLRYEMASRAAPPSPSGLRRGSLRYGVDFAWPKLRSQYPPAFALWASARQPSLRDGSPSRSWRSQRRLVGPAGLEPATRPL